MVRYDIDAKEAILKSLYTFPYLTADRITKLLFTPGSIQNVREHLRLMYMSKEETNWQGKQGLAWVHRAPMFSQARSKEYVYWLSTSGRRKLRSFGNAYDFTGWNKEPAQLGKSLSGMEFRHHITTTDFFIAAIGIPDLYDTIQVKETTHYFHIRLPKKTTPVIPDGILKILLPTGKWLSILPEIDLDTESDFTIKQKIHNYISSITSGQFAKDYGIGETPLIVFYTPEEARRNKLVSLIEIALLEAYAASKASWLRVGSGTLSPELFFEKIWIMPGCLKERKLTSLLV